MSVPAASEKYSPPMRAEAGGIAEVRQLARDRSGYVELHGDVVLGDAHDVGSLLGRCADDVGA